MAALPFPMTFDQANQLIALASEQSDWTQIQACMVAVGIGLLMVLVFGQRGSL